MTAKTKQKNPKICQIPDGIKGFTLECGGGGLLHFLTIIYSWKTSNQSPEHPNLIIFSPSSNRITIWRLIQTNSFKNISEKKIKMETSKTF